MYSTFELISEIKKGKMIILVDDEDRENEGDLVLAADKVTPQLINFMIKEARGLVCLTLTEEQLNRLNVPLMVNDPLNFSSNKTAFTVSIEARYGISTGISAYDRARTIYVASRPNASQKDIVMPGHVFPIKAKEGGVLQRAGHTEGSIDLIKLAGLNHSAVICEIINEDGSMARFKDLKKFSLKHNIKMGTIVDLVKYRLNNEFLVEEVHNFHISKYKNFKVRFFNNKIDNTKHIVFQKGNIYSNRPVYVRVHVNKSQSDLFDVLNFEEDHYFNMALRKIDYLNNGIVLYIRKDKKNNKNSDFLEYGIGAQILKKIGIKKINLIANNPFRGNCLKGFDLEIIKTIPLIENIKRKFNNINYIKAKY